MLTAKRQESLDLVAASKIITDDGFVVQIKRCLFLSLNYYFVGSQQSLLPNYHLVLVISLIYLFDCLFV